MITVGPRRAFALVLLALAALSSGPAATAAPPQAAAAAAQTFASADEAVAALVDAIRKNSLDTLRAVLGPGSEKLVDSGDAVQDNERRQRFLASYDERHEIVAAGADRMIVKIGKDDWPMPIPLVQAAGRWHFDTEAGAQELVDRWIGRNEIAAIRTSLAFVDAQKVFFSETGEYAQRLLSSPGKHDGLYWPAAEGEAESPLAPLVEQAKEEGYPVDTSPGKPRRPYLGYYFKVLSGQGANTPEGAKSYVSSGRLTGGFALVAWPATYGTTGIVTLIVNQDGVVYQKDLGPRTSSTAAAMTLFDPDLSWAKVEVVN